MYRAELASTWRSWRSRGASGQRGWSLVLDRDMLRISMAFGVQVGPIPAAAAHGMFVGSRQPVLLQALEKHLLAEGEKMVLVAAESMYNQASRPDLQGPDPAHVAISRGPLDRRVCTAWSPTWGPWSLGCSSSRSRRRPSP